MKVGVLIPTRGDRPKFLAFAKEQLERQTRKPDEVLIFDEKPKTSKPDITYRYRKGSAELARRGVDLIIFWEDDDYYRPDYIERLITLFKENREPDILGINTTIYYNIFTRKFAVFSHPGRASMMATVVKARALNKIVWPEDSYSYTDLFLWKSLRGVSVSTKSPLCVGIKHGLGLCGGGGHVNNWPKFNNEDRTYEKLESFTDSEAINFYNFMTVEIERYKLVEKPFLSIITRRMVGKRKELFERHKASVIALETCDYEQIFILDRVGVGMLNANRSFRYAAPVGEFVYLLDDDDRFTNPEFIKILRREAYKDSPGESPDVIFFRMKIGTGDGDEIYPKPTSWETREPRRGEIGGSCFVVKRWVFERYITHFGYSSFGDWNFITKVLADKEVKAAWLDVKMAETGKVSRGGVYA